MQVFSGNAPSRLCSVGSRDLVGTKLGKRTVFRQAEPSSRLGLIPETKVEPLWRLKQGNSGKGKDLLGSEFL